MKEVEACLHRNYVPSRECKNFNKNVNTLVDIYWQGEKTVLPMLLRVTYLSNFYSTALIADPDAFLTAVSHLPAKQQRAIAQSIAEPRPQGVTLARSEAIRSILQEVPQSSPNHHLAQMFLGRLETENISLLVNYFPPKTFSADAAEFHLHWFSRDLHRIGEEPLWPPASQSQTVYRITVLPAFFGPQSAMLTSQPNGADEVTLHSIEFPDPRSRLVPPSLLESARTVNARHVADFSVTLTRSQFWQMPTELVRPAGGLDGAEYILEGVQDGAYHVVVRWCPGVTHQKPFSDLARQLFDLSRHKLKGGC